MRTLLSLTLVFAAACASETADNDDGIEGPGGKYDGRPLPMGTYTLSGAKVGQFTTLTLQPDHTFTRAHVGLCHGGGTCMAIQDSGMFLYTHSATTSYLHFYATDGSSIDRAAWTLDTGELTLDVDGIGEPFTMNQENACQAAGGACVALVPGSCSTGTVGDANQYSCGGGLGVECCLPPAPDNSCQQATDCHGLLPQFVRVCADGTTDRAHWACLANQCQITACQ